MVRPCAACCRCWFKVVLAPGQQTSVVCKSLGCVHMQVLAACDQALPHNKPARCCAQARAFKWWLAYAGKQRRQQLALVRNKAKQQQKLVQGTFACWAEYVQHRHLKAQLEEKQGLQVSEWM